MSAMRSVAFGHGPSASRGRRAVAPIIGCRTPPDSNVNNVSRSLRSPNAVTIVVIVDRYFVQSMYLRIF
jgi:hypothetical protein